MQKIITFYCQRWIEPHDRIRSRNKVTWLMILLARSLSAQINWKPRPSKPYKNHWTTRPNVCVYVCVCVCLCLQLHIRECRMSVRRFTLYVWVFSLSKRCSSVCMFRFVISLPIQLPSCNHYVISKRSVNRHIVSERNTSEDRWGVPLVIPNVI